MQMYIHTIIDSFHVQLYSNNPLFHLFQRVNSPLCRRYVKAGEFLQHVISCFNFRICIAFASKKSKNE